MQEKSEKEKRELIEQGKKDLVAFLKENENAVNAMNKHFVDLFNAAGKRSLMQERAAILQKGFLAAIVLSCFRSCQIPKKEKDLLLTQIRLTR